MSAGLPPCPQYGSARSPPTLATITQSCRLSTALLLVRPQYVPIVNQLYKGLVLRESPTSRQGTTTRRSFCKRQSGGVRYESLDDSARSRHTRAVTETVWIDLSSDVATVALNRPEKR